MNIFDYIDKLRKKPENDRQKFVLIVSFSVTAIIFAIWLFTLVSSITHNANTPKPLETESYKNLREGWQKIMQDFNGLFGENTPSTTLEESPIEPPATLYQ